MAAVRRGSVYCVAVCVVIAALGVGSVEGAAIYVASGESIQDAIDAALPGDSVVVAVGTYNECIDFKGKAITVSSYDPSDPTNVAATIIDGGAGGSVVTFKSGEGSDSVLTGLTIRNGSGTDVNGVLRGGGIYCASSSPTITYNIISGNQAAWGGGVCCCFSSASIQHNTISGNTASVDGGGILCGHGSPTIANNTIIDNHAIIRGGGIYCTSSSPPITDNMISGNTAFEGGGISCIRSSPFIANNTVNSNTSSHGGGIHCHVDSCPTIKNNTIALNAASEGGGIRCQNNSLPVIRNSIIAFSASGGGLSVSGSPPTVEYNDVHGNTGGNYVGMSDVTGTSGNISVDPLFAQATSGDFHLRSKGGRWYPIGGYWVVDLVNSPCIDGGDPASDYTNETAPNGGRINMGAYGNRAEASRTGNRAPTAPAVVDVTPGVPTTTDDLTASASGATDADGDTLTYEYEWSKTTDGGAGWGEWSNSRELAMTLGDGASGNVLDHRLTAKDEGWKARARAFDGLVHGPWAESARVVIGNSPPTLAWLGVAGFLADGHDPGAGAPDTTEFALRVKITDPDDTAPTQMRVQVQRVEDGRNWVMTAAVPLSPLFGTWTGGMMCGATTTLPNGAYRYRFYVEDDEGAVATGDPAGWSRGPKIIGPPQLWCTGLPGRESDYLHPETGTAKETRFKFSVQCTDGEGEAPVPHRIELQKKRGDGTWSGFHNEVMTRWAGGLRIGKYYNFQRKLPAGEYRYRFVFADDDGSATGADSAGPDGTQWQPGPVVSEATADAIAGSGGATVTSLAALASPGGAEIVFSLSAPMSVDARILNVAGRPVRTICRSMDCGAGANTLLWNAQSDQGLAVPNGTYLVEVMAKGDDGAQARALAQVRVSR